MSYEDIATRRRLSQNIRSNLAGIGQGYADTAFAKYGLALDQRRMDREDELFEYKQMMDRRRIQREDEVYEQKQMVDRQERHTERAGAGLVRIMASDLSTEEKRKAILGLQEEFKNIDLAGTDAGRGMFGAYGMFGRRTGGVQQYSLDHYKSLGLSPEQSQKALERKHLGTAGTPGELTEQESLAAKYSTARQAAVSAENWQLVNLYDTKLARFGMAPEQSSSELEADVQNKAASDTALDEQAEKEELLKARQAAVSAENWQLVTLYDKKLARSGMQPRKSANELEAGARDKITPSAMSDRESLTEKYLKGKQAAEDAVNPKLVALYEKKLVQVAQENERAEDQRTIREDRRDPLDVSIAAGRKMMQRAKAVPPATEDELLGDYDIMAVLEAGLKAGKITQEEMDSAQRILKSDPTKEADIRKALGL